MTLTRANAGTSDAPPAFFFMHLQWTAGTALWRRLLSEEFDPLAMYPGPGFWTGATPPASVLSVPLPASARWRERRDQIRLVTGHFPLCAIEPPMLCSFATLTLLRDPVERTLSYLRHHQAQSLRDRHKSLEEIYEDRSQFEGIIHNHMTKMLALTPAEMTAGMLTPVSFTDAHLERAKQRLAAIDAVDHQESFGEFCAELTRRFGWRLGRPRVSNTTAPTEVTPALRARIAEDNALDVALHRFARGNRV